MRMSVSIIFKVATYIRPIPIFGFGELNLNYPISLVGYATFR
jgi:hypothetical protein